MHIVDHSLQVKQRGDGVLLVRVSPAGHSDRPRFDAVFSFRNGDPQYSYWLSQLLLQEPHVVHDDNSHVAVASAIPALTAKT